jgi:lipopolysaccharide export LptBFGC system permease protein LptF
MFFYYFLQKFYKKFVLFFVLLSFFFAMSNLFIKLPFIRSFQIVSVIFGTMLPLISFFAIPMASVLAVQITIGNAFIDQEMLFLFYSQKAFEALKKAIFIFSLSVLAFHIPLCFKWAPQSYQSGKELLFNIVKNNIFDLDEKILHTSIPGLMFYFKKKRFDSNNISTFETLFLVFQDKKKETYFFTAQQGRISENALFLYDGFIYNMGSQKYYKSMFKQADIQLENLLQDKISLYDKQQPKFYTWKKLWLLKNASKKVFQEFHKRLAQILWQFLFPLIAIISIFVFGRSKNNNLNSLIFSGILFFIMYAFISLVNAFITNISTSIFLILLYFPPFVLSYTLYFFYKKKYRV